MLRTTAFAMVLVAGVAACGDDEEPSATIASRLVVDNPGIGTTYADADVSLHTQVTRVTMEEPDGPPAGDPANTDPRRACLDADDVRRIRGTITGVGQGGYTFGLNPAGMLVSVPGGLDQEYDYTVDYQLLYPRRATTAARATQVVYFHVGGGNLLLALDSEFPAPDRVANPQNVLRAVEQSQDRSIGKAALRAHASYFAANRWLRGDGTTVCRYRNLTYTAAIAAAVHARYPNLPDVAEGAPMPCEITADAATSRDLIAAGKLVHQRVLGQAPRRAIAVGLSGGARLALQLNSGLDGGGRRSGGLFARPYDAASGLILDYLIVRGIPDAPGIQWRVDPQRPFTVPTAIVMGNADALMPNSWAYLAEIAGGRGLPADAPSPVDLAASFRLYEIRDATHLWAWDEGICASPYASDLGPTGPLYGALIRNARARLEEGRVEPQSRYAGHLDDDGRLLFERSSGDSVATLPFADDAGDTLARAMPASPSAAQLLDWKRVDALLAHGQALAVPLLSCRLGSYTLTVGSGPTTPAPLLAPTLVGSWAGFDAFVACVKTAADALEAQGLYDSGVETPAVTASAFRSLF